MVIIHNESNLVNAQCQSNHWTGNDGRIKYWLHKNTDRHRLQHDSLRADVFTFQRFAFLKSVFSNKITLCVFMPIVLLPHVNPDMRYLNQPTFEKMAGSVNFTVFIASGQENFASLLLESVPGINLHQIPVTGPRRHECKLYFLQLLDNQSMPACRKLVFLDLTWVKILKYWINEYMYQKKKNKEKKKRNKTSVFFPFCFVLIAYRICAYIL